MGRIESHFDLDVWQVAMQLVEDCYRLTGQFPAVSIPTNIAEGFGRDHTGYFVQFLRISMGSARELETLLILSERLSLATPDQLAAPKERCTRASKMLRALIRTLDKE